MAIIDCYFNLYGLTASSLSLTNLYKGHIMLEDILYSETAEKLTDTIKGTLDLVNNSLDLANNMLADLKEENKSTKDISKEISMVRKLERLDKIANKLGYEIDDSKLKTELKYLKKVKKTTSN